MFPTLYAANPFPIPELLTLYPDKFSDGTKTNLENPISFEWEAQTQIRNTLHNKRNNSGEILVLRKVFSLHRRIKLSKTVFIFVGIERRNAFFYCFFVELGCVWLL